MAWELVVMSLVYLHGGFVSGLDIGKSGYGAVVDAGSSGSRVYIYTWSPEKWTSNKLPEIKLHYTYKVKPGLSSYAGNRRGIASHVRLLLEKTKSHVPKALQATTPLLFMATAGLRLLSEGVSLQVIEEAENLLDDATINPFWHDTNTVRISSGEGEGAFSWIAVNYLNGNFNKDTGTVGVLEMGGASSQISFLPEVDPLANKFPIRLLGRDYPLYTHSYLGTGQEAILRWIEKTITERNPGKQYLKSPCMLQGDKKAVVTDDGRDLRYFGTGDPKLCDQLIEEYFTTTHKDTCHPKPCGLGATYQPSIPAGQQLYLMASYYFVARNIQLIRGETNQAVLRPIQYKRSAYQYCARKYADVVKEMGKSPYISMSCSSALAIHKLLTLGFGLDDNATNLRVVNKVNGTSVSWTLGALIDEVNKRKCGTGGDKSGTINTLNKIILSLRKMLPRPRS